MAVIRKALSPAAIRGLAIFRGSRQEAIARPSYYRRKVAAVLRGKFTTSGVGVNGEGDLDGPWAATASEVGIGQGRLQNAYASEGCEASALHARRERGKRSRRRRFTRGAAISILTSKRTSTRSSVGPGVSAPTRSIFGVVDGRDACYGWAAERRKPQA